MQRTMIWLDQHQWLFLMLAAPLLLFPSFSHGGAILLVPLFLILPLLARRFPVQTSAMNLPLLLLFFMVAVSCLVTPDMEASLSKITGVLLGILVYFILARQAQNRRAWWFGFVIFLLAGAGIAVFSLLGTDWTQNKLPFLTRISRYMPQFIRGMPGAEEGFNPNQVAGVLLWIIPFVTAGWFALVTTLRTTMKRCKPGLVIFSLAASTLLLILLGGVLVMTQSRTSLLALALALGGMFIFSLPRNKRWISLGLAGLAVVGALVIAGTGKLDRVVTLLFPDSDNSAAFSTSTIESRQEVWGRALDAIRSVPVTGMGMNIFRQAAPEFYPVFNPNLQKDFAHAHNEFLQAALDLGIPGAIALLGIYIAAVWLGLRVWVRGRAGVEPGALLSDRVLVLGLLGGLAAHFLYGLTDAVALGARPGFVFWMLLGLVVALEKIKR